MITMDVAYAGVGFVDTLLRSGAFPLPRPPGPGIEVTGRVRATGEDVEDFEPGQIVAALLTTSVAADRGGYAQVAAAHHSSHCGSRQRLASPGSPCTRSGACSPAIASSCLARVAGSRRPRRALRRCAPPPR